MSNYFFKNSLVAYIDILGFKQFIDEGIIHAKNLDEIITETMKKNAYDTIDFSIKLFSDCICISCDYNNNIKAIDVFFIHLSYLQLYFSFSDYFLRGALTIGEHFENKNMIFSKGLVKAYNLEQSAIYPRIIIDDNIIKIMKANNLTGYNVFKYIMKAPDNKYFIDYLELIHGKTIIIFDQMLGHKESILRQTLKYFNNNNIDISEKYKILEKYKWLSEYHNFKASSYKDMGLLNQDEYDKLTINNSIFTNFSKVC